MVGNNEDVVAGNHIVIEAGTSITLACGASTIHMNQAGVITISGSFVTSAAMAVNTIVAPMTEVVGSNLLTQAGLVCLDVSGIKHIKGGETSIEGSAVDINGGMVVVKGAPIMIGEAGAPLAKIPVPEEKKTTLLHPLRRTRTKRVPRVRVKVEVERESTAKKEMIPVSKRRARLRTSSRNRKVKMATPRLKRQHRHRQRWADSKVHSNPTTICQTWEIWLYVEGDWHKRLVVVKDGKVTTFEAGPDSANVFDAKLDSQVKHRRPGAMESDLITPPPGMTNEEFMDRVLAAGRNADYNSGTSDYALLGGDGAAAGSQNSNRYVHDILEDAGDDRPIPSSWPAPGLNPGSSSSGASGGYPGYMDPSSVPPEKLAKPGQINSPARVISW